MIWVCRAMHSKSEFAWTDADFKLIQSLIYKRAGISLQDTKRTMVYSRLSRRLRDVGRSSFKDYLNWLQTDTGPEWQEFINALTTNLTSFFREAHHFEILAYHLKSRPANSPWRVWCNAASTGEEPYSIVMTAVETLGNNPNFTLLASDIDSKVLTTAAQGVYPVQDLENISLSRRRKFFLRGKHGNNGMAKVKPELQKLIRFDRVNLIQDGWSLGGLIDVIFCRNVMIYFDASTQRKVLERMHRTLAPGGLLFAGHSENFSKSTDLFIAIGKTVYKRVEPMSGKNK